MSTSVGDIIGGALILAVMMFGIVSCLVASRDHHHFNTIKHDQNECKRKEGVLLQDVSGHYACVSTNALYFWHEPHFYGDDE